MVLDASSNRSGVTRGHTRLLIAASVMTTLLVTLGGIVCATESAAGCPDWPGCYGRIVPPPQINAIIEYTHRFVAALTSPLIIAGAILSWRRTRAIRWISRPLAISLVFLIAVIIFGAFAVLTGLPPVIAALDVGSALLVLTLVVTATTVARSRYHRPDLPDRLSAGSPFARLSYLAMGAVYALYVSGVLVAGPGSLTRCLGWPMWRLLPDDAPGWPQVARLGLAAVAAVLIVAAVAQGWRQGRRHVAVAAGATFAVELVVTALLMTAGTTPLLLVLRVAAAVVLWALLVVMGVTAGLTAAAEQERQGRGIPLVIAR